MKAFVTGGTGFIGGRVVAKLRERFFSIGIFALDKGDCLGEGAVVAGAHTVGQG